jgi:dihydrofolate reductase
MKISILVAMADNGVIGRDNGLPWRLSTDLKRFKAQTMGKPVVMGRKCYESIGKPLPGRPNFVLTRDIAYAPEGVRAFHSFDEMISAAEAEAEALGVDEVCVIGGGEIYRLAMDVADLLHVTHVDADVKGDTHFPEIDPAIWKPIHEEAIPAGDKDQFPTKFVTYFRQGDGHLRL